MIDAPLLTALRGGLFFFEGFAMVYLFILFLVLFLLSFRWAWIVSNKFDAETWEIFYSLTAFRVSYAVLVLYIAGMILYNIL